MKLTRFSVQGFKNITRELVLDDLRDVNVIHGANSVGKSNLMQAIGLGFVALGKAGVEAWVDDDDLRWLGFTIMDILPANHPAKLVIDYDIEFIDAIVLRGFTIKRINIRIAHSLTNAGRFHFGIRIKDKDTLVNLAGDPDTSATKRQFTADFLSDLAKLKRGGFGIDEWFGRVDTDRSAEIQELVRADGERAPLALEMYDSHQSEDVLRAKKWSAFRDAMRQFRDITGPGDFLITYQRREQRARLLFETADSRLPLRSMGSGLQQLVALFGHILMSRASVIAIEEPELNLRWNLQKQVSEVLQSLTHNPDSGIRQLFITSHSPAFESGDDFWLMEAGPDGPTISRRPRRELPAVLGPGAVERDLPESAVPTWISSQGVLEVPPRVRKALGLEHGGSVMFEERADGVLMRNQDRAFEDVFGAAETHAD